MGLRRCSVGKPHISGILREGSAPAESFYGPWQREEPPESLRDLEVPFWQGIPFFQWHSPPQLGGLLIRAWKCTSPLKTLVLRTSTLVVGGDRVRQVPDGCPRLSPKQVFLAHSKAYIISPLARVPSSGSGFLWV